MCGKQGQELTEQVLRGFNDSCLQAVSFKFGLCVCGAQELTEDLFQHPYSSSQHLTKVCVCGKQGLGCTPGEKSQIAR